jgi:hypothetical protein
MAYQEYRICKHKSEKPNRWMISQENVGIIIILQPCVLMSNSQEASLDDQDGGWWLFNPTPIYIYATSCDSFHHHPNLPHQLVLKLSCL